MNLHVIPQYPGLISIIAFVVKHNDLFPYLVPQLVFKSFEGCSSTSQLCASTTQHKGQHREGIQYSPGGLNKHMSKHDFCISYLKTAIMQSMLPSSPILQTLISK